ncbi:MAG TPA: RluA family pseudouridine synthase [bacterium]|nr:RluA family pseudouridine synthase [bacterium]
MNLKIIYEDKNIMVIEKTAGIVVFPEGKSKTNTLADYLIKEYPELKKAGKPPRYGIVHRLDKDTSGILLIAKNNSSLSFLQKQFKERKVIKKYLALVAGIVKKDSGKIETLMGRSPKNRKKQRVFLEGEPKSENKRRAITLYKVIDRFKNCTFLEVEPKTGRKHQIRCHLAWIHHPIIGDKLYGFKNQLNFNLNRHFLHASYLKITLPTGEEKEFRSDLPSELKNIIKTLRENDQGN